MGKSLGARCGGVAMLFLGACSATPAEPAHPAPTTTVKAVAPIPGAPAADIVAIRAADWLAWAEEAQKQGSVDVASACRGRAYQMEHDPQTLSAWIDGLISSGENDLARRVWKAVRSSAAEKGGAELVKKLDERIVALPISPAPAALLPTSLSADLHAAYEAEAAERLDEAAAAFEKAMGTAPDPYHVGHLGSLWWKKGEPVRARQAWSRARILLREAGASFDLLPVETFYTQQVFWRDDKVGLSRMLTPIDVAQTAMSELQLWSVGAEPRPVMRAYSAARAGMVTLSDDGQLVELEGGTFVIRDVLSGVVLRRVETGQKELGFLLATGSGDKRHILTATHGVVQLWNDQGQEVSKFQLEGTTPTITRVYRAGQGTMHDNILQSSPTWAVSTAISKDLRYVAVGGSDSKVRLFDRTTGKKQDLEYTWKYEERRHMGGNPDLNLPLDMRFSDKGDKLVVIYRHGQMITWGTAAGKALRTLEGKCSVEEATKAVNRYTVSAGSKVVPTEQDQESCGVPIVARFDDKLQSVVTTGSGVRVRDVDSAAGTAFLVERELPEQYLAWSPSGRLAMADLYGAVALWSPGDQAARRVVPKSPSGPVDPQLTSNGRFLWYQEGQRDFAWDVVQKKRLPVPQGSRSTLLGVSSDGKFTVQRGADGVRIEDAETGNVLTKTPAPPNEQVFAYFASTGKKVLLRISQYPKYSVTLCDMEPAACKPVTFGSPDGQLDISDDGKWLAAEKEGGSLWVWEMASGKAVLELGKHVRSVAFARDGSAVAWIEHPDREVRNIKARFRRLGAGAGSDVQEFEAEGWPQDIALSPDGSEAWVLLEGSLRRWRPGPEKPTSYEDLAFISARRVQVSDDGRTLILTAYNRVYLRAIDPALTPMATLFPLFSGGILTTSASGAVDGSAEAPASMATRVKRGSEALVFDGFFGWDAAHVDGLWARALRGERVEPPVPSSNGSSITSL